MIRIAFFRDGPFLPPREGGSRSIYGLTKALLEKGVHVTIFRCYRGWDDHSLYLKEDFDTVFIRPQDFYTNSELLRGIVEKFEIDICQFDSSEATVIQGPLLSDATKIIWEVHNVNHVLFERLNLPREKITNAVEYEKKAIEVSDLVLTRSKEDKDALVGIGADPNRIKLYRGAIDSDNFHFRDVRDADGDIVFVGHLYYKPNENAVRTICEKIAPATLKLLSQARFVIVGLGPSHLKEKYQSQKVRFLGEVADLNTVFDKARVALCPVSEGSGTRIKILEYLAAGIPTISTRLGIEGLEKEIEQCLIVEDDFDKYPSLIEQIFRNEELSKSLATKGNKYTKKNRTWRETVSELTNYYEALLRVG